MTFKPQDGLVCLAVALYLLTFYLTSVAETRGRPDAVFVEVNPVARPLFGNLEANFEAESADGQARHWWMFVQAGGLLAAWGMLLGLWLQARRNYFYSWWGALFLLGAAALNLLNDAGLLFGTLIP